MLNLRAEYQKTKYNYETANVEPDGESIMVTIIDTIVIDSDPCFVALTVNKGDFICDSIGHFTSSGGKGWID